jgi:hypothetical protein
MIRGLKTLQLCQRHQKVIVILNGER